MTTTTTNGHRLNGADSPLTGEAVTLFRRGRVPIPLIPGTKRPLERGWERTRYADEGAVVRAFTSGLLAECGLGVRLGDGLGEVDLDSDTARRAAPLLLPDTEARSGRPASPGSHWWYALPSGDAAYVKITGPDGSTVVELRATSGHQTALPPTIHPTGEPYLWEVEPWGGESGPALATADELREAVACLGLVSVLADAWPGAGARHDAYLALAGALLRPAPDHAGLQRATGRVIDAVARLTHDEDGARARVTESVPSTVETLSAGRTATGWTSLRDLLRADDTASVVRCAQAAADHLRAALGIISDGEAAEVTDDHRERFATDVQAEAHRLRVREAAAALVADERSRRTPASGRVLRPGGSMVLDSPELPVPIWGEGERVLMAEGEALLIVGGSGVGKTTLGQQLALGRCGLPGFGDLLGLPVREGAGRVLYLAMDRPAQAVRSLRRMVTEEMREHLDDRLMIWPGPPPVKLTAHPGALLDLCREAGADTVIVDSLKDAGSVVDDEGGSGWNVARQTALAEGVEVVELHHNRKGGIDSLDDVYGSTWVTSGAGSVLTIVGSAGDAVVRLRHLKQPAAEVGPLEVLHDHLRGRSSVWDATDLVALAAGSADGITALDAARVLFDTAKPTHNEREKARRRLQAEVRAGHLSVVDSGDQITGRPMKWGRP